MCAPVITALGAAAALELAGHQLTSMDELYTPVRDLVSEIGWEEFLKNNTYIVLWLLHT